MTCFLLPKTVSNGVEGETLPICDSLTEYLTTMTIPDHSSTYCSINELIHLHKMTFTTVLSLGIDMNHGEDSSYSLIIDATSSLDLSLLNRQSRHGALISMMRGSTTSSSIQYLYKLCSSYHEVYVCKPESDCQLNDTKYIVALDFIHMPDTHNLSIPYYFRMKLEDINSVLGQLQLEYLRMKKEV